MVFSHSYFILAEKSMLLSPCWLVFLTLTGLFTKNSYLLVKLVTTSSVTSWFLHRDNVSGHTSFVIQQFLTSSDSTPLYSPDFAQCDFVFPKMKMRLKEHCFNTVEEVLGEMQKVLNSLILKTFGEIWKCGQKCWNHCEHA